MDRDFLLAMLIEEALSPITCDHSRHHPASTLNWSPEK